VPYDAGRSALGGFAPDEASDLDDLRALTVEPAHGLLAWPATHVRVSHA
jgi:hypothetical protein